MEVIDQEVTAVRGDRLWQDDGWTARVVKNEEDDGWAVAMTQDGQAEPALVGPWTMGRDKKNPKPLDVSAFNTLVKTASEVLRRHEQQLAAQLRKSVEVDVRGARVTVTLEISPDEENPSAKLTAMTDGEELASTAVLPDFSLTRVTAKEWADKGYRRMNLD